jgi:hypothetical protein
VMRKSFEDDLLDVVLMKEIKTVYRRKKRK